MIPSLCWQLDIRVKGYSVPIGRFWVMHCQSAVFIFLFHSLYPFNNLPFQFFFISDSVFQPCRARTLSSISAMFSAKYLDKSFPVFRNITVRKAGAAGKTILVLIYRSVTDIITDNYRPNNKL